MWKARFCAWDKYHDHRTIEWESVSWEVLCRKLISATYICEVMKVRIWKVRK